MNQSKIIISILTIFALVISYFSISAELKTLDQTEEDIFLGNLSTLGDWLLKIILIGIAVYSTIEIIKRRKLGFLFPFAVSIISLVVIVIIWKKFETRESSPIILQAQYDGDINGITLYLRKNNTYKINDFAFLGGTNHYGEYIMKGDTILLSKKYPLGSDRDVMSDKLLKGKEFVLIKPDSNGQYDENEYIKLRLIN